MTLDNLVLVDTVSQAVGCPVWMHTQYSEDSNSLWMLRHLDRRQCALGRRTVPTWAFFLSPKYGYTLVPYCTDDEEDDSLTFFDMA